MNWAWASSLDQLWRAPTLPMWVTLAAASLFAIILLVTLFRAEKSVANGALTVITLLAIGIAVAATLRTFGVVDGSLGAERRPPLAPAAALPALACLDGLAGEAVETACERSLFASADGAAAAVSYTAVQISRLASQGSATAVAATPESAALRRALERDRYGLVAHVLSVRDGCTPTDCAFYRSLADHNQIATNMTERSYEALIGRYAPAWGSAGAASSAAIAGGPALASTPANVPTGRPVSGDFPSSASIPPVNIMTPEPPAGAAPPSPAASKPPATAAPKQATAAAPAANPAAKAAPAAKKPPPAKKPPAAAAPSTATAPVPLAPPQPTEDN